MNHGKDDIQVDYLPLQDFDPFGVRELRQPSHTEQVVLGELDVDSLVVDKFPGEFLTCSEYINF